MPSDVPHPRGGKFQSKAQQRMWFARHGEKAGREVAHNTAPRGYKGSHPINAAGIPDRVGKAFGDMEDVWHASVGAAKLRNARNAGRATRKLAQTEQARQATVSTNMLKFKATRNNRFPAAPKPTVPGQQQRYGGGSIVGKRDTSPDIAKGIIRQSVAPTQARVNPTASVKPRVPLMAKPVAQAVIGKAGFGEGFKAFRAATGAGRAGMKAKAVLPSARTAGVSRHVVSAGEKVGQGMAAAERNPLATGVVAGSVGGGGLVAMRRNNEGVAKAHGDPEDARYARLGAGATALGLGGAASAVEGGRRVVRDTRAERRTLSRLPKLNPGFEPQHNAGLWRRKGKDGKPQNLLRNPTPEELRGAQRAFDLEHGQWEERKGVARQLENLRGKHLRGAVVHGRPAAFLGGGALAVGGAEALRRKISDRRWN